ncbi:28S rRNA (cytosine-C(5))-methyltransferase isoform X3 [Monomorium pharaonis]|uniref:28S rRNA (cytosine-C(5))-methyltransferase isoform X3 n=1 Tax=Monomorium pharaonis TaxID=307658 RepID=UPI001745F0B2|nr:28S rRNA (cytosine-C(5))-methyltransferase isoform X3 [Monomorium pharaonis]
MIKDAYIIFRETEIPNMSNEFVHSVTVPRIYKFTADIVRRVREDGASLKTLIYEKKHPNVAGIYGLSVNTLRALPQLDQLLDKTQILREQPRLNPWLAKVLITELLWRKGCLKSCSKPVLTVLAYENKLREEFKSLGSIEIPVVHKDKVQKPRYVRINTLLLSVEKAISIFQEDGWQLLPRSTTYSSYLQSLSQLSKPYFIQDFHIPEIFAFPPSTFFYEHSCYQNGELILQDKASCLPIHLLNPVRGSVVLDMCAAPGMKATHVAAKLQNCGKVYAVEIDAKRFETLVSQIKKTCSSCVIPLNRDALTLDPKLYSHVEYILVDPTCSGSGIVDRPKQSDMDGKPESKRLQNLQSFQVYLLRYALFNFPNVKRIIYSTCSLYPEENEEVIDEVLADIAVFERNFDMTLPKCKLKGGNEYKNLIKIDLTVRKDNVMKTVAYKRNKYGKMSMEEEISVPDDLDEMKISRNVEFVAPDIKRKVKVRKSKKKVKEVGICSDLFGFNHELTLNESKKRQKKTEDTEIKKWKKGKLKHENILEMGKDKEIIETEYDKKQQNVENKTKLSKIKNEKIKIKFI